MLQRVDKQTRWNHKVHIEGITSVHIEVNAPMCSIISSLVSFRKAVGLSFIQHIIHGLIMLVHTQGTSKELVYVRNNK